MSNLLAVALYVVKVFLRAKICVFLRLSDVVLRIITDRYSNLHPYVFKMRETICKDEI